MNFSEVAFKTVVETITTLKNEVLYLRCIHVRITNMVDQASLAAYVYVEIEKTKSRQVEKNNWELNTNIDFSH